MEQETYFVRTAAAFVRGRDLQGAPTDLNDVQRASELAALGEDQLVDIFRKGGQAGLKLHKFKRTMGLARVRRVLGALQGLAPSDLLDVGSGRGAFLWPLLKEFPSLAVTAIDHDKQRADDLQAVHLGGIQRLTAYQEDVTQLSASDGQFDVVTMLEVLEHLPRPASALREVVRVARRFVILSVPSKADDNPQHIHLYDEVTLRQLFTDAGVRRLTFDYVLNHMIVVANVAPE